MSDRILTERQVEVLSLMSRGIQRRNIADSLNISEKTVDNTLAQVRDRLGARSTSNAITIAIYLELVTVCDAMGTLVQAPKVAVAT